MSDKSLKPFDAAALTDAAGAAPEPSAEAASGLPAEQAGETPGGARLAAGVIPTERPVRVDETGVAASQ